jgi:hypothetical protein
MVGIASVNDQSVTGAVTSFPFSHNPGTLHVHDTAGFGHAAGSNPVTRAVASSRTTQTTITPTIFNAVLMSHSEIDAEIVLSRTDVPPGSV